MSRITHISRDRITFEDGAVYIDGYGQPPLSASQVRKLAKWLLDRAGQMERKEKKP